MRLLRLDITGFKSFQNRTTLVFPRGITAVVGPNGCGKSNIVDALRWVMGEQSAKQLRGKSMEDLIFAGADGKQPLNMAEVSLLIDNSEQAAGDTSAPMAAYTEIMVTRRIYRSGESVYMINRQACRLKDIHNLFLGSGTGRNSFAVIQQGNIGALTDASPEERRYFIEDAADITKYKERKKETLARIKTTRENLIRIADIMTELKKRIGTLERQAAKAKKFKEYKSRVKTLEISIALWHFESLSRNIREKTESYQRTEGSLKRLDSAITDITILETGIRQRLSDQKQALSSLTQARYDVQRDLDRTENSLDHLGREIRRLVREIRESREKRREVGDRNQALALEIETERTAQADVDARITARETKIADYEKRLETGKQLRKDLEIRRKELNQAHMELTSREARHVSLLSADEQRKSALKRRLRLLDEELLIAEKERGQALLARDRISREAGESLEYLGELAGEKAAVNAQLALEKDERDRLRTTLRGLDIELSGHRSRYETLKAMDDQFGWYDSGVKALMNRMKKSGDTRIKGILADILRPEKGYEKALEACLGEVLQYLVVDTSEQAEELIKDLVRHNDGTCGFIAMDAVTADGENDDAGIPPLLLSHVSSSPEHRDLLRFVVGGTHVTEDLATAIRLRKSTHPGVPMVTVQGERITGKGLITGGGKSGNPTIFDRKNELDETRQAVAVIEDRKSSLAARLEDTENRVRERVQKENHLAAQLAQGEKEKNRLDKELFMSAETLRQSEKKTDVLTLEKERLMGDEEDLDSGMARHATALADIRQRLKTSGEDIQSLADRLSGDAEDLDRESAALVDLKTELARLKAERDNHRNGLLRLERFLDEGRQRRERLDMESTERKKRISGHSGDRNHERNRRKDLEERLAGLVEQAAALKAGVSSVEAEVKDREEERRGLEKRRNEETETLRVLDLELSQLRIRRENITARIEEKYHHQLNQYKLEFAENEHDRIDVADLNIPFLETELSDLNVRIAQLGDVNLSSIAEYDEVKERYDFMQSQAGDLEKSLGDLEAIIGKINDVSRDRFLATFHAINEKLAALFPRLFEGGSAGMVLTDPSSPLETGVELMIQPPGKKLTRLSLLSGGEKALSAIAFVFSVFLIKPASFCIMDEIDAPLDDANVTRFNTLVKHIGQESQILVITHNKVTMEFADILFGVTMEKRGVSKIVSVSLTDAGEIEPGRAAEVLSLDSQE